MTYEESLLPLIHQNCNKCMQSINFQNLSDDNKNKRCEECEIALAIKALEKQIPMKVEKEFEIIPKCPVCHQILYNDFYCRHCGQALDLSEVEK